MRVQIIQVPYDSGHRGVRMGRGPEHFVRGGVDAGLRACGHDVRVEQIEASDPFRAEIRTAFELHRKLAARVRSAVDERRFPLVLAGNCNSSLGALAGLRGAHVGVIWLDAHGDFNTPETTASGFLDGMALATLTGRCWQALTATIPGFSPVPEANVIHVGGRDFDAVEREALGRSEIAVVDAKLARRVGIRPALKPALDVLGARAQRIYVHIDMDVLDPGEAQANEFASLDGLAIEQVEEAIRMVGERFTIGAAGFTAYDPEYDEEGRTLRAGVRLMEVLTAAGRV